MKQLRSLISIAAILALTCVCLSGCGSSSSRAETYDDAYTYASAVEDYDYETVFSSESNGMTKAASSEASTQALNAADTEQTSDSKLIYTADVSVETVTYDDTCTQIRTLTEKYGGYFESSSSYDYGSYRSASYTVRIPQENYRTFVTDANGLQMVVSFSESVDNVSQTYYDTELRLESAKKELEGYQALYAQATDVDDMISIAAAINDVQCEIDSLSGTLRYYDALVNYSTVNINVSEVSKLPGSETPAIGFGARLAQAFRNGWNNAVDGMQDLLIGFANGWFGWLIVILIAVLVVMLVRRRRKKKAARKSPVSAGGADFSVQNPARTVPQTVPQEYIRNDPPQGPSSGGNGMPQK